MRSRGASDVEFVQRVKCVVVGNDSVGKTSLLTAYTTGFLPVGHTPTIFEQYSAKVIVDGELVHLDVSDTAGMFSDIRALSYTNTDVFVVCYSVVDLKSFESVVTTWIPELRYHSPQCRVVIVGMKIDLRETALENGVPMVTKKQGAKMAKDMKAQYLECSVMQNSGLMDVFEMAARVALKTKEPNYKMRACCMCSLI